MTTKARDEADDRKDEARDEASDARKDARVEARRTKDGDLDTTHLPESINEPPGSNVIVEGGDGENVEAEKALTGEELRRRSNDPHSSVQRQRR